MNKKRRTSAFVKIVDGAAKHLASRYAEDAADAAVYKGVFKIDGALKHYDWGSRDWIPALLGQENAEHKPYAELWFGTHPAGQSRLASGAPDAPTLESIITDKSGFYLGESFAQANGGKLPFLFKALAAEKPLSIQAHPDFRQAEAGFDKENALGIPLDSPRRNYKDNAPKPELICALSQFTALCGFRPTAEIRKLLSGFGCPFLARPIQILDSELPEDELYRAFLRSLFSFTDELRQGLSSYINRYTAELTVRKSEYAALWAMIANFAAAYPRDPAVIAPLYLNVVTLEPGEAFFVPPSTLHAYVHGLGLELMGASDNVLRGGLTPKHVDIDELLSILKMEPYMPRKLSPSAEFVRQPPFFSYGGADSAGFPFTLSVLRTGGKSANIIAEGPVIAFMTEGSGVLSFNGGWDTLSIKRGEAVFIAAGEDRRTLTFRADSGGNDGGISAVTDNGGDAVLYLASTNMQAAR
ncbi:MAG: mannose-6-phosphate isomerase, class I [Spirochaetaceae bacterium]|jgi:mannose-6-phosphate isomerase|nr:mannose-6-phosphate isomerase, class I [Spirochaetaceae bacterium]